MLSIYKLGQTNYMLITMLIIFFVIGLTISIWGFASAIKYKRKINASNIEKIFLNKKIIDSTQLFNVNKGIFALFVKNFKENNKEFFLPIYIFKSNNFNLDKNNILNNIKNKSFEIINEYLIINNLTINDIYFVQLEVEDNELLYQDWITRLKTNKKGFNK